VYDLNIPYFNTESTPQACASAPTASAGGNNLDYAGNPILTAGQLEAIAKNQPTYVASAGKIDIPWQMIAVIHVRETGLKLQNPGNGQGLYQFVTKQGGPYPAGPVSQAEFERQTDIVAKFIKDKAASNVAANRNLTTSATPEAIKDTFFSYNGRSSKYADQAQSLGFDRATQPYEGSPYVMNKADAKRDPNTNPTGWGQVKRDFGPIEYPANQDYGAFVQYGALTGAGTGCNKTSGPTRDQVVALATQELEAWGSGTLKSGEGYKKYSQGREENWCADFVSWLYAQAGYPLIDTNEGNVPAVATVRKIGEAGGKFKFTNSPDYIPRPGDITILQDGMSHVNIVVGVEGTAVTIIGGNQGAGGGQGSSFDRSSVTKYTYSNPYATGIVGYVSPD